MKNGTYIKEEIISGKDKKLGNIVKFIY